MRTIAIFFEKSIGFNCLKILANQREQFPVVAITTSQNFSHPPVRDYCQGRGITLLAADNPNDPGLISKLKEQGITLAFAVSYAKIFKTGIIGQLPDGIINLHPALLPRHGGCYPTMWSIIEGDTEAGCTLHRIEAGIDTGPIISQIRVPIESVDTGESLYAKQVWAGEKLFSDWQLKIIAGQYSAQPQQPGLGCYHPKAIPFAGYIPWEKDFALIERTVRAFQHTSFPGILTKRGGADVEVFRVERAPEITIATVGEARETGPEFFVRCRDAVARVYYY